MNSDLIEAMCSTSREVGFVRACDRVLRIMNAHGLCGTPAWNAVLKLTTSTTKEWDIPVSEQRPPLTVIDGGAA